MEVGGGNGSDKEDRGPAKGQARRRPPADGVPEDCCWRSGIGGNERRQGMKINRAYRRKMEKADDLFERGKRGAHGDEVLEQPEDWEGVLMKTPKKTPKAKRLKLTSRNMTRLQQELGNATRRKNALWKANQILVDEIADVKTRNVALYADNLAYKTKIAEWELGAGIGVEEVWRRLNNTLLKKAQAQVEALVKKARHARKSRKK